MKDKLSVNSPGAGGRSSGHLSSNGNFPFQSAAPDPIFTAGYSSLETLAAQRQLGWVLNGTYKGGDGIKTGIPKRLSGSGLRSRNPDVLLERGFSELKFAGDRVHRTEVQMDVWLLHVGFMVRYDIVPHPFTGKMTPRGDLERLKTAGIPFRKWDSEFWRLGRGEGLRMPMTWKPKNN